MITDVYVVYNNDNVLRRLGGTYTLKVSPFFHFIDSRTLNGQKEAFKLKGSWGARMDPFAIVFDGDKAIKAFYSETGENIIESLLTFLNSYEDTSIR